jgi:hypothetical protein
MVATDGAFWLQHVDLQHSVEASSRAGVKHQVLTSSACKSGPEAVNRLSSSIVALADRLLSCLAVYQRRWFAPKRQQSRPTRCEQGDAAKRLMATE